MIAVITADIINSTQHSDWQKSIDAVLKQSGKHLVDWNIYRGDSLQIRLENPAKALWVATQLKSGVRQQNDLDIRIAIGIGAELSKTNSVTQNTGSAYVNSGRLLEQLTQHIAIKTDWPTMDLGLNAGLSLYNALAEQWTSVMAQYVYTKLAHQDANQEHLAQKLNTSQSNVSRVLARANFSVLQQYLDYFEQAIKGV